MSGVEVLRGRWMRSCFFAFCLVPASVLAVGDGFIVKDPTIYEETVPTFYVQQRGRYGPYLKKGERENGENYKAGVNGPKKKTRSHIRPGSFSRDRGRVGNKNISRKHDGGVHGAPGPGGCRA